MKIIITESQSNTLKKRILVLIKEYGLENAGKAVGSIDNLLMILNIKTPMDFLHLFDDLDIVQSEEEKNLTLFRYKPNQNLMIYNRKYYVVYFDYNEIWSVLEGKFGLNYSETQRLTKEWLAEVYKLRGITTENWEIAPFRQSWLRSTI